MTQSILSKKELDIIRYSNDPVAFITEVVNGPSNINNGRLICEKFHQEWIEMIENNRFTLLLAPRGHGKTWIIAAYIIWRIVKDPKIRIIIITINKDMAQNIMHIIETNLEFNDKLIGLYGQQKGYVEWARDSLRVLHAGNQKEPTLNVVGITGGMVGGHYDIIILDDITDKENSRTELGRSRLDKQLKSELNPMINQPDGKMIVIGTKWHESDIYSTVMANPDFSYKVYKAIISEPQPIKDYVNSLDYSLLSEKEFKSTVRNYINSLPKEERPIVLFPEIYPYEELYRIRMRDGGVSFSMQYQNEIVSLEDSPIKQEWVEESIEKYKEEFNKFKKTGEKLQMYMGVDLASKGAESDYFSITIIGIYQGKIFIIDGLRTKNASMFRQFDYIKSYDNKWTPGRIGIEQAAQQKMIVDQLTESTILPIVPIKSSAISGPMSRAQILSVLFETGRIFLNPKMDIWADELIMFPRGSHNDTMDSLSFAIQASKIAEEDKHIDWNLAADMIVTKKAEPVRHVNRNWNFIKV